MKALSFSGELAGVALSYRIGTSEVLRGSFHIIKGSLKTVRLVLSLFFVAPQIGVQIEPGKVEYVRSAGERTGVYSCN